MKLGKSKFISSKSILLFSFILISAILIIGFAVPYAIYETGDEEVYLLSNDLIKNFKFEGFDDKPVSASGQAMNNKLQFEAQASWRINPEDIQLINVYTLNDNAYIRFKVGMTSKVNMYTTLDINEGAENNLLNLTTEEFLVAHYRHSGLAGDHMFSWKAYIDWEHYDFGNIKQWNTIENDFDGDLIMSFDIAQSPLPTFQTQQGDTLTKNFDYIAVSSVAVINNLHGKLDNSVPNIVGITPRDYEEKKSILGTLDSFGGTKKWDTNYNPNIELVIHEDPLNSFDGGIMPQTAGSSMNPTCKDGSPIWNPQIEQESMMDCKFIYHIGSISPLVTEYYGTLSYTSIDFETIDYWNPFPFHISVKTRHNTQIDETYTRPIALHVTNRYIQTEVKVVFDVFCSYKIDVGSDNIEDYDLDFPQEYYDLLLWLTSVDGFGGGYQYTDTGWDLFGDYTTIIIIIIVIIGGILLFIFIVNPILKARRQRKLIESAVQGRQ